MMRKQVWVHKAICILGVPALMMLVSASALRADTVFTMTFGGWGDTTANPRTFHVTSSSMTESLFGYSSCFPINSCITAPVLPDDPILDISLGGDPNPFNGIADITIPPDMQEFFNNTGGHIASMDASTPFNPSLGTFECDVLPHTEGYAFSMCGFKLSADGTTLLARFSGGTGIDPVPEPASWALLLTACGIVGTARLLRRSKTC